MAEQKDGETQNVSNVISEHTGQFDARFMLWRMFCADNNLAVETLPSELTGEIRDKWDKLKDEQLHKPAEGKS
ncbi:MAG TPA: hypothetical protein VF666_21125 [Pyrinomonadaceae bacterium]